MDTKLVRVGFCSRCGDCCQVDNLDQREAYYKAAAIPFKVIRELCKHFDTSTHQCNDYENRPDHCKEFPTHPVDILALPRCTFSFILVRHNKTTT